MTFDCPGAAELRERTGGGQANRFRRVVKRAFEQRARWLVVDGGQGEDEVASLGVAETVELVAGRMRPRYRRG